MITHEPECVALKRQGAEYVSQLLSGKTRQEVLEFWRNRTNQLRLLHNNKAPHTEGNSSTLHYRR